MNFARESISKAIYIQKYFEVFLLDFHQDQCEPKDRKSPYRTSIKISADELLRIFSKDTAHTIYFQAISKGEKFPKEFISDLADKIFEYFQAYRKEVGPSIIYFIDSLSDRVVSALSQKK